MNDTHQEDEVLAGGPLFFTVPAYGFVMALYLDSLGRRPTGKVFPPTLCGTHKEKQIGLRLPGRGPSKLCQRLEEGSKRSVPLCTEAKNGLYSRLLKIWHSKPKIVWPISKPFSAI